MSEFQVAIIGQIAKWKGQDVFIKAAKLLHTKFPKVKFLIIGDVLFEKEEEKNYKKKLLELADECDYIKFLGYQNNILELIKEIDLIVHASVRAEPFGRIIIEGMAAKKPVIASAIGGPIEIIENGISGVLFEPGNHKMLAKEIEGMLIDNEKYYFIADSGYQRFVEKYDIRKTISQVEHHISSLFN